MIESVIHNMQFIDPRHELYLFENTISAPIDPRRRNKLYFLEFYGPYRQTPPGVSAGRVHKRHIFDFLIESAGNLVDGPYTVLHIRHKL